MRVYYTDAYALKSPAHQELQTTRSLLQVTPEQVQRCSGVCCGPFFHQPWEDLKTEPYIKYWVYDCMINIMVHIWV